MNANQKLSPKYWVMHDTTTDDIIVETLSKSLGECNTKMDTFIGHGFWIDNPDYEGTLISIERVKV